MANETDSICMAQKPQPITDDLAIAIHRALERRIASGQTVYQISQASGVSQIAISQFRRGLRATLHTSTASRLCRVLGLQLVSEEDFETFYEVE